MEKTPFCFRFLHYTNQGRCVKPPGGMKFAERGKKDCQVLFFGQGLAPSAKPQRAKKWAICRTDKKVLCKGNSQAKPDFLWKKAVEKPVEIVEKFGFSTAKPGIYHRGHPQNTSHFPEKYWA